MFRRVAVTIASIALLAAATGCAAETEPIGDLVSSTAAPTESAPEWAGAAVSGTGQSVVMIDLREGLVVCEATVSGNDEGHVSVVIIGEDEYELLVNDIASEGTWSAVVRVAESGTYLVEVSASQAATWEVACARQ